MSLQTLILAFIGWTVVALVFEAAHCVVTRFFSIGISKIHLCEGFWVTMLVVGFLSCGYPPDFKMVIPPFTVYMIQTSLIGKLGLRGGVRTDRKDSDEVPTRVMGKSPDQ